MIFKNIDFHNVSDLSQNDDGTYTMHRFPLHVEENLQGGQSANVITTGVELRFKIKSGSAKIKLYNSAGEGNAATVYQYRGAIIDSWQNYCFSVQGGKEVVREITNHPETNLLQEVTDSASYPFSPNVIRLVFNSSAIRFVDVEGDIEPPSSDDIPSVKYLAYGSSITHGSQSYSMATSFVSQVASYFKVDALNKGLAGNARLEKAVADEIAEMGKRGEWDFATLCLGINVTNIPDEDFKERVDYMLGKVSKENPEKHIFAISPVYSRDDMIGKDNLNRFRKIVENAVAEINLPNLHYINGLSLLSDARGLSGDLVHPSPDGANEIARNLIKYIKAFI